MLVATVLVRKSAVQRSSRFTASSPKITTNPETIPTKLIIRCTRVNANVVMPKIMMRLLSELADVTTLRQKLPHMSLNRRTRAVQTVEGEDDADHVRIHVTQKRCSAGFLK